MATITAEPWGRFLLPSQNANLTLEELKSKVTAGLRRSYGFNTLELRVKNFHSTV